MTAREEQAQQTKDCQVHGSIWKVVFFTLMKSSVLTPRTRSSKGKEQGVMIKDKDFAT